MARGEKLTPIVSRMLRTRSRLSTSRRSRWHLFDIKAWIRSRPIQMTSTITISSALSWFDCYFISKQQPHVYTEFDLSDGSRSVTKGLALGRVRRTTGSRMLMQMRMNASLTSMLGVLRLRTKRSWVIVALPTFVCLGLGGYLYFSSDNGSLLDDVSMRNQGK
ncbi:hypothetical protein F5Y03DRAFT_108921 [Xylaria venustula]|nr:hypothetical protein F5Y03DRAFT_108921 [Xylaria venustula]